MPTELADDELLNVPLANLQPGELRRAFLVQAREAKKKQEESVSVQGTLTALQGRQEEEKDREALKQREELLLAGIQEREREIVREGEELDDRTIKLADGRRAYVDGDGYRDAQGRELRDADRAEAEQHHLEQPKAATWQEHQELERKWQASEQLKQKVEKLQTGEAGADVDKALTSYEKDFKGQVAASAARRQESPDFGSSDYMAELGLSGDFKQAATTPATIGPTAAPASIPFRDTPKVAGLTT